MRVPSPRSITITVGLPASGKTTWALQAGFEEAISLDDCRQELWGDYTLQDGPGGIPALLARQVEKISAAMAKQVSIVVHNTHHLREFRRPLLELAKTAGYRTRIVFFDINPEECRKRNRNRLNPVPESVMEEFVTTMEIPAGDEADEVTIIQNGSE